MMAMMTGRVLLVCALCVLWCGVGGRCEAGVGVGAQQDGGKSPPESKGLETSSKGTQDLKGGAAGAKENSLSTPTEEDDEDVDDDIEEGDDDDGGAVDEEEENVRGQSGQEGTVALGPGSSEKKLIGSEKQTELSISSAESTSPSGSRELNVNLTQTEVEGKKETDKNTPAVENPLTTVNGENTLPAGIVEGNPSPPPPQDGVGSREQDGEGTTSESQKNVPLPESAATPQSHQDKGSEGTGEDTKATTVTANTTDTTNTQNSDGSTAVSHTTSPLLLLLVVACAAAAAVVAA
ncbi:mucin-associated surface protein (MASP), putative [Trypanosoma cruzi]|uniref:Mucin-associated surface protein (MASP), putative n=2 Tax=Trypanosoma cruzi TaxID=5693 RepID=Q4DYY4_TRYCC|nr:mucin-associated surface protein (MASP), putative [Trypanosoma cruzi]EAN97722.1 mucin-associated surface protein (MASP), putative [Trypanosoma cruzi]|eukprot:XP_819573.1 mucin-associated surface protein (MASP) [Trypanosoma cruzi strain CL Brener]